jgi:hypothetical protein
MGESFAKQVTFDDLTFILALYSKDNMKVTLASNSYQPSEKPEFGTRIFGPLGFPSELRVLV